MEPIRENEDYAKKQLEIYKLQNGISSLSDYINHVEGYGGKGHNKKGASTTPNRDKIDSTAYTTDINLARKSVLYSPSNNKPQQFTNGYGTKLLDIMSTVYSSDQKMMDAIVKLGEAPEVYKSIVQSLMMELSAIEKTKKLTKKIKIDFGSRN